MSELFLQKRKFILKKKKKLENTAYFVNSFENFSNAGKNKMLGASKFVMTLLLVT